MEKGPVELGSDEEEGESESKVINQIFGRLQFPKNEVRYLENIFSDFRSVFPHKVVFHFIFTFSNFWGGKRASSKKLMNKMNNWQKNQLPKLYIS